MDGNNERLLTPGEVATLFRVDPKTVSRWAASGRITSIRTPGGHRRFRESEVRAILRGDTDPRTQCQAGSITERPVDGIALGDLAARMERNFAEALTWATKHRVPYFGGRYGEVVLSRIQLWRALRPEFTELADELCIPSVTAVRTSPETAA